MPLILSVDTTATPVSCALIRDGRILASYYAHTGMTHSQTLMPMITHILKITDIQVEQLDALAVNAGPGSFTGVRIGVSAVKGLAFSYEKPCIPVSTLESMAENVALAAGGTICCVMDARCQQVYTALFERNAANEAIRLTPDEAISIEELKGRLQQLNKPVMLVGDGSELCYKLLRDSIPALYLAPSSVRYQSAVATGVIAERLYLAGETIPAAKLLPMYLRLPQAERELRRRQAEEAASGEKI